MAVLLASAGSSPRFKADVFAAEQLPGTNEPPRLSFVANQSIATDPATSALLLGGGTTLVIAVSATDPNPQDTLTLTASFGAAGSMPPGATLVQISTGTWLFSWTPNSSQEGVWSPSTAGAGKPPLSLVVHDDGAPQLQDAETVTIAIGPSANVSPHLNIYDTVTLMPIASPILANEGDAIEFDLQCVDENAANLLTFQASGSTPLPAGATLTKVVTARDNPVKYAFSWAVQAGQAGTYSIDFICGDSGSPAIEERRAVRFEIAGPASAPRILGIAPNQGASAGGTNVTITGTALAGATAVGFGGVSVPFTAVNDTTVVFTTTPGTAGALSDIEVTTPSGVGTRVNAFQYNDNADTDRDGVRDDIEGTADPDGDGAVNLDDPDSDGDGIADAVEGVADTDGDAIPNRLDNDSDADGISDRIEGLSDLDVDGIANYRDADADGDGSPDALDNCPVSSNAAQSDFDGDDVGDVCDNDSDNDRLANAFEVVYGTNASDVDTDNDGVSDGDEVFLAFTNPLVAEAGGTDDDFDGVFVFPDGSGDNCPVTPNPDQLNSDGDLLGDACDDNDDNDPLLDADDHCPTEAGHPRGNGCLDEDLDAVFVLLDGSGDNCPVTPNGDQLNSDDDADGDACDDNDDNDPLLDADDHCPTQAGHPRGNGCLDEDFDAVFVLLDGSGDNCPVTPNGDQRDTDSDGAGDACDADDDNDGFVDAVDGCPLVPGTNGGCPPVLNGSPSCGVATATIGSLWPANHKMVPVGIRGVTDPDGDPLSVRITSIRQDEPTNTAGDGDTSCDATGVGGPLAQLRSERAGNRDGRFYHVFFTADDGRGGTCTGTLKVAVPHDRSKTPIDGGPLYPSCR